MFLDDRAKRGSGSDGDVGMRSSTIQPIVVDDRQLSR